MKSFVKILCSLFAISMIMIFASCNGTTGDPANPPKPTEPTEPTETTKPDETDNRKVLNVLCFTDEIPRMIQKYIDTHPDCGFIMQPTIIPTTYGEYQPALIDALKSDNPPDIYAAESSFVLRYAQGDISEYAMPYEDLGISNVNKKIDYAEIAPYTVNIGTRPSDGKVVALCYQTTGGAFIYRRSIAKDVWGTDDPEEIKEKIGGGTGTTDKLVVAAEELKAKGYKSVSTIGDIWKPVANSSKSWIDDEGKLYIDPNREEFFDYAKHLYANEYINIRKDDKNNVIYDLNCDWSDDWYADMKKDSKVFGYFGPAWFISYTISQNCADDNGTSAEDWAVCESPIGFFWGGSWIFSSKNAKNKAEAAKVIEWITLDTSYDGLQNMWANGTINNGVKDTVASSVVMKKSSGEMKFLGGQNPFPVFIEANKFAKSDCLSQYDDAIEGLWKEAAFYYATGIEWKKDDKTVMPASSTKEALISYCKEKLCKDLNLELSNNP